MKNLDPPLQSCLADPIWQGDRVASRLVEMIVDELVAEYFDASTVGEIQRIARRYPGQPHTCIVRDQNGRPMGALQVADELVPDIVQRSVDGLNRIREAIGPAASSRLLTPRSAGWRRGCSYVLYPYCRDLHPGRLRSAIERRLLAGPLLDWLYEVNRQTVSTCTEAEREALFGLRLSTLANDPRSIDACRRRAEQALRALQTGAWSPSTVMMHSDLWVGNVMVEAPEGDYRTMAVRQCFKVIDWPGCLDQGYPCFDLFRACHSLGVGPRRLAGELRRHAALLNDKPEHASHHLSAAAGQILMTLENFPIAEFNKMTTRCERQLQSLGL
jgi:hypothetical protein